MDDNEFAERAARLEKIAKVLMKLPAEVRSDAFHLLKPFVSEHSATAPPKKVKGSASNSEPDGAEEAFFAAFDSDTPADNAKIIAAYFYREYGAEPFTIEEVREKADDVGITIPARIDMTFLQAKDKGKKLFARAGKGKFKPTVHGEAHLKTTYAVKRGTKKRQESTE